MLKKELRICATALFALMMSSAFADEAINQSAIVKPGTKPPAQGGRIHLEGTPIGDAQLLSITYDSAGNVTSDCSTPIRQGPLALKAKTTCN